MESEDEAEVVMFSGGEIAIHKHILDFVDLAQARPIKNVTLNTASASPPTGASSPSSVRATVCRPRRPPSTCSSDEFDLPAVRRIRRAHPS
ncbi:hypothetical protein [Streptomyces sp. NPDC000851]